MPDAITRHTTRPWMRENANNIPRQKLMRMTLDALRDLAYGQDQLAVGTQREINKLWDKMEDWLENKAVVDNRQHDELIAKITRLGDLLDAAIKVMSEGVTVEPEQENEEPPAPTAGPPELTDDTPGWSLSNTSRSGAPVGDVTSEKHPGNPTHPDHAHWLKVMEARSLAYRVYNMALSTRGTKKRLTHEAFGKILVSTKAWKDAGNPKISASTMFGVFHAAIIWEYREVNGEISSWGRVIIREPKLEAVMAALVEILELNSKR